MDAERVRVYQRRRAVGRGSWMRWSYNLERSRTMAAWLFLVAAMVVAMVVVGGATRLTGSGLSITQWKPVAGALPPLGAHAWQAEFARYQRIPQYRLVNPDMTLRQFKGIYGWEWAHRLLARLVGLVFFVPFVTLLMLKRIPRRLVWRCWLLFALGALQGLVGWWMVASGLETRVYVAPERLATHFGLALIVFMLAVWTGWEAWSGRPRGGEPYTPRSWTGWSTALVALVFFQMLLGALVAGNHAGLVDNDWPLMNGHLVPSDYAARGAAGHGLWATLAHSQAAVQFNHRVVGYTVFLVAVVIAGAVLASPRASPPVKLAAGLVAFAVTGQVLLGIATVMTAAPLALDITHQLWAVALLTSVLWLTWRLRRP
jgi:cytochrome c oxidase assembly protein subunit 15